MIAGEVVNFVACDNLYFLPTGVDPTTTLNTIQNAANSGAANSATSSISPAAASRNLAHDEPSFENDSAAFFLEHDPRVSVMVTNYRLVITFLLVKTIHPIDLPIMTIANMNRGKKGSDCYWVDLQTKHVWCLRLASRSEQTINELLQAIDRCTPKSFSQIFAFAHFEHLLRQARVAGDGRRDTEQPVSNGTGSKAGETLSASLRDSLARDGVDSGWTVVNLRQELQRMTSIDSCAEAGLGLNIAPWFQVVNIAQQPEFKTYPVDLIMPRRATIDVAKGAAKFRQNSRIPSISWVHINTGASLSRSSQPRVGAGAQGGDDQLLCSYLNQSLHAKTGSNGAFEPLPITTSSTNSSQQVSLEHAAASLKGVNPPASATPPSLVDSDSGLSKKARAPTPPPPSLFEDGSAPQAVTNRPAENRRPPSLFGGSDERGAANKHADPLEAAAATLAAKKDGRKNVLKCEGRKLHIIDCRSKAAAAANMANGGGFELVQYYDRATISFMQLGNIHEVRGCFSKLTKLVNATHQPSLECPSQKTPSVGFMTALEETGWVRMTQRLLWAGWKITNHLCDGDSVLVHCTDGWDRTSQTVCLAMLMLDSYYRTVEGFCTLVVREWLQMGHRFADRCNHDRSRDDMVNGNDDGGEGFGDDDSHNMSAAQRANHTSPVFIQFIDCVYQLLRMYPDAFEFTPAFLVFLTDHVMSCRFGTFLFNCHRSRYRKNGVVYKTASLWSEVEHLVELERTGRIHNTGSEKFISPFFNHSRHETQGYTARRLQPSFHAARYCFWGSWYFRYRTDCIDTGIVGLEPDNLTPLIEAFISMVPQYQQKQSAKLLSTRRVQEGDDDITEKRYTLFQQRIPVTALLCDWVVVSPPSMAQLSSTSSLQSPVANTRSASGDVGAFSPDGGAPPGGPSQYLPRSQSDECELCGFVFTFFNRRHCCRKCCRAVCGDCSPRSVPLQKHEIALFDDRNATGPLRICNSCCEDMTRIHMSDEK